MQHYELKFRGRGVNISHLIYLHGCCNTNRISLTWSPRGCANHVYIEDLTWVRRDVISSFTVCAIIFIILVNICFREINKTQKRSTCKYYIHVPMFSDKMSFLWINLYKVCDPEEGPFYNTRAMTWTNLVVITRWCYKPNIKALSRLLVLWVQTWNNSLCRTCDPKGGLLLATVSSFKQTRYM